MVHSFEEEADEEEADTDVEQPTGEITGTMGVIDVSLEVDRADALTHSG